MLLLLVHILCVCIFLRQQPRSKFQPKKSNVLDFIEKASTLAGIDFTTHNQTLVSDFCNGAPRVKIKTKIKERVTPHPLQ
jgi:hypothetical protein